jgi:hypothetical protein
MVSAIHLFGLHPHKILTAAGCSFIWKSRTVPFRYSGSMTTFTRPAFAASLRTS